MQSALMMTVILLNLSTGFTSPDTPGIRTPEKKSPTALMRYPEAALEYFLKTPSNLDHKKCLAEFKKLLPVVREKICVKYLVGAESFSLPSKGRSNYVADDFERLVCDTYKSVSDTFIESFDFNGSDGNPYNTSAQSCVSTNVDGMVSWVISPGYHEGFMFLFVQSIVSDHHRLTGLLEEMPDIQRDDWDQKQVEMWYAANRIERSKMDELNSEEESAAASRSLCEMDRFEWFRTCSVGYLAWKHSKNYQPMKGDDGVNTKGNYVDVDVFSEDFPKCIKSNVELGIEVPNKIRAIDVIPCAINKEMGQADFFLTSDPFSPTSMFTVVPIWKDDVHGSHRLLGSEVDTLFKLELYMTNVRVLKFFNNLP